MLKKINEINVSCNSGFGFQITLQFFLPIDLNLGPSFLLGEVLILLLHALVWETYNLKEGTQTGNSHSYIQNWKLHSLYHKVLCVVNEFLTIVVNIY